VPLGLTLSILLHGGALAWMYLAMLSTAPLKPPEPAPIEVALITPSDLLALKKGSTTATELEAKAKDEPKPDVSKQEADKAKPITAPELPIEPTPPEPEKKVEEAPPPPEPPKPEPPKPDPIAEKLAAMPPDPPPGPTPDELKKAEEERKAEEMRQAEEKKKAEEERQKAEEEKKKKAEAEKKKAEEKKKEEARKKKLAEKKRKEQEKKKKQQQADRLAALLDKDPTRKGAPNSAAEPQNPTDYSGPTAGASEGDAPQLSVREQDLLRAQISQQLRACWKLPGGGGGIETMVVTVRWRLRPDGSLEGEPAIEAPQSGPVFQIAAEAAIRAVKSCSPFTLPPDRYWAWKSIIWDFDPREML